MFMSFRNFTLTQSGAAAFLACLLSAAPIWAHGGSHGSSSQKGSGSRSTPSASASKRSSKDFRPATNLNLASDDFQPLHGGQVTATKWHYFEVVYLPRETRLYVYSASRRPLHASAVQGEIVMTVNGAPQQFRYPLQTVIDASPLKNDKGYAAAVVDVSRVRDHDMQVAFDLKLASREEPRTKFTQVFALYRQPVSVRVVALTEADRPLVELQRDCPVMDSGLSDHGQPIKMMVGDQPLFVCCEGCIEDVREKPRHFLQKAAAAMQANRQSLAAQATTARQAPAVQQATAVRQSARPQVGVFWAMQTDDAAIRVQGKCPVMDEPLGAHGRPLKVVIDGRPIFVCCEGCIDKVVRDREFYFHKVAGAAPRRLAPPPQNSRHAPRRRFEVDYATDADRAAIKLQGVCPVLNQPLGGHGAPIKISSNGQSVFVCCKGCVDKVKQNPEKYLGLVVRGQQPEPMAEQENQYYQPPITSPTCPAADSSNSCGANGKSDPSCH